jgi:hypothetical protein
MGRTTRLMRNPAPYFVGLILLLGLQTSDAQTQPSDMPRNLLSRSVPYEEGMAHIQAQDAARPKAVQPILPPADSGLPTVPTPQELNQANPRPPERR